ncbi:alpha-actinin-3-like [Pollicipes pollicipes]|uniref:alpha-actinin-3-like n=1 Tax=Pollicipes pollicipes TaxID=41117 RepID=UPI0018851274|nr:alpha-actinin-3-like [Pollicipes pollicipes]
MEIDRQSLEAWARDKPLSILQLDPVDRAVLRVADERDAIQKKTFTKWVNKHLKKCGRNVRDLFVDLRDGKNLLGLLEVLSGERLPSQKGQLRFHQLQNVQIALDFLHFRKIKLVNIRADDIVDGNPKLTLGLVWTIILHFQVGPRAAPAPACSRLQSVEPVEHPCPSRAGGADRPQYATNGADGPARRCRRRRLERAGHAEELWDRGWRLRLDAIL